MATLADMLRQVSWDNPNNPYSSNLLADALRGSLSNAESLGRGAAVAPLGIFGDVNALAREYVTPRLPAKAQELLQSMPAAPTTEQILANVPRVSSTRPETSGMEQLGAAMNPVGPVEVAKGVTKGLGIYGNLAGNAINDAMVYGRGPLAEITPQPMRMFIGENAKTWDKTAAENASKLEKAGIAPEEIWKETGVFRGPEGKWRQEISDVGAKITDDVYNGIVQNQKFEGPASKALTHEELYKAYPKSGEIQSGLYAWKTPEGSYDFATNTITAGGPGTTSQKSAMLHEIQHAIQDQEGFARGGSPGSGQNAPFIYGIGESSKKLSEIEKKLEKTPYLSKEYDALALEHEKLTKQAEIEAALEGYRRLAGEAEARATQVRMKMTPEERRAKFPYESYDVPKEQLIVKGVYK
jgi:hypothetical protein